MRFLAAAQGAEVREMPVRANQPQQAPGEPGRLPQRHADNVRQVWTKPL
jgi:hypothetical protein